MKSRRVLQIFVGVLSVILLACLALFAAVLYLHSYVPFIPQQIVDVGDTFQVGLDAVFNMINVHGAAVPATFFGAPGLLLLLAIILILTKNKGKDGKNIAGCIFALLGVALLTGFMLVFVRVLFATEIQLIAGCAIGGVLALFLLFIGLALGVKPKKQATAESETSEEPGVTVVASTAEAEPASVTEETASEELVEEAEATGDSTTSEDTADETETETDATPEEVEEVKTKVVIEEKVSEAAKTPEPTAEVDTPATKYVPKNNDSIRDIVDKTYGKEDDTLSSATLQKLSKVRALYEAKVITEQEYIKLIHKYLGF